MSYLEDVIKQFEYYKSLGEKAIVQIPEEKLFLKSNDNSNNIAIIIKHIHGNMMSRWTNFLTTDGEKSWRNRDVEFNDDLTTKVELLHLWDAGWNCLFNALTSLSNNDLEKEVFIRNISHTVQEAINRQLAHYPFHIGQIVFLAKSFSDEGWESLSIPKGKSEEYNNEKFMKGKQNRTSTNGL